MWSSSLFWKLFLVYVGLNLSLAVARFCLSSTSSQRVEINRQVEQRLLDTAIVLRGHVGGLIGQVMSDRDANPDDKKNVGENQKKLQKQSATLLGR